MADVKVAIVTGASRGIGSAISKRLASDGFSVVVNYSDIQAPAEELVRSIQATGGQAVAIRADVSNAQDVSRMFQSTEANFGGVDVLINNAGVMKLAPIFDSQDELFDCRVAINLRGVFTGMREAAKHLHDGGRIIIFSSSVVGIYQPTYAIYAATKASVESTTQALSKEIRGRNITINAIAPRLTSTRLFFDRKPNEIIENLANLASLERLGPPEEIADVVAFLAGPHGGWINGQVLRANGGNI